MKCWGYNSVGELGYGDTATRGDKEGTMGAALGWVDFGNEDPQCASGADCAPAVVLDMSLGDAFGCAVVGAQGRSGDPLERRLKCWGDNRNGQLGYGDLRRRGAKANTMGANLPFVDLDTPNVRYVAAGKCHACAIVESWQVKCWGLNQDGRLSEGAHQPVALAVH